MVSWIGFGIWFACGLAIYVVSRVGVRTVADAGDRDDANDRDEVVVMRKWAGWPATGGSLPDPWEQLPQEDRDYLKWFFK